MDAPHFIAKWRHVDLTERSASQQHFLDLCDLFDHPKPAEADPAGDWFTFEKGAEKRSGGDGWADVWKKSYFGWEYKGRHKDLEAAWERLVQYGESLCGEGRIQRIVELISLRRFRASRSGRRGTSQGMAMRSRKPPLNSLRRATLFDAISPANRGSETTMR